MTKPSQSETVHVRDFAQAMLVLDTWRRGDLRMATRKRGKADLERLFEATGTLRMRAWRRTGDGVCKQHGKELVELVIRRHEGQA
jgi:hypothetical protein